MPGKSHKPFGNYPKPQLRDKRVLTAESTSSVGQQLQVGIGHDGIGKWKWKWKGHTHTHTPSDPWALVVFARLGG